MACFTDVDVRMMWNNTIMTATRFTATGDWADRNYSSVSQIQISMSESQLLAYMIFQVLQDITDILF